MKFKYCLLFQYDHILYTNFDNVIAQKYQRMDNNSHNNEDESPLPNDLCNGDEAKHLDCNKHLLLRLDSTDSPVMPWFGMDIGGTLVKLVYFEPKQDSHARHYNDDEERRTLANIHRYLIGNKAYGESGHRDVHLQLNDIIIRARKGSIHFIRFPTSHMSSFIKLAKDKGMAKLASTVCATGGGAYKFENDLRILEVEKYIANTYDR